MKLIGLLLTLAILGYTATIYLTSSPTAPDGNLSRPKDYTDQAKQSTDAMRKALEEQQEIMNNSN